MSDQVRSGDDQHPISQALFGWVSHPMTGRIIFWGLAGLSLLLLLADLVVHRHTKVDIEKITGAYGLYGFLAFGFVVLMGWPLGTLLRRGENFYGDQDEADDQDGEAAE
ncbi:MAG: hypothetical protein AAGJ29_01650 [Pseudomonadota bacterium]